MGLALFSCRRGSKCKEMLKSKLKDEEPSRDRQLVRQFRAQRGTSGGRQMSEALGEIMVFPMDQKYAGTGKAEQPGGGGCGSSLPL